MIKARHVWTESWNAVTTSLLYRQIKTRQLNCSKSPLKSSKPCLSSKIWVGHLTRKTMLICIRRREALKTNFGSTSTHRINTLTWWLTIWRIEKCWRGSGHGKKSSTLIRARLIWRHQIQSKRLTPSSLKRQMRQRLSTKNGHSQTNGCSCCTAHLVQENQLWQGFSPSNASMCQWWWMRVMSAVATNSVK